MRRFVTMVLVVLLATSAFGVSGNEVMYRAGSASAFNPGDIGVLETNRRKDLAFVISGKTLSILYARIKKVEYHQEVARHLGVAAAIAVGLIKKRERKHFITLTYADEAGEIQAAVFEVPKSMPQSLLAILAARAPQACVISRQYQPCPVSATKPLSN